MREQEKAPEDNRNLSGNDIAQRYVRHYSEIPGLQHEGQIIYQMIVEPDHQTRIEVRRHGCGISQDTYLKVNLSKATQQQACNVLLLLYENAVAPENVLGVVEDVRDIFAG